MKTVTITRYRTGEEGTFGILNVEDTFVCLTLEPPWVNNEKNVSCIPEGGYFVKPHLSPRFGKCYQVMDVPDRTKILFHPGNTICDTDGCIMLGFKKGIINNLPAILSSKLAHNIFAEVIKRHKFKLIIEEDYPEPPKSAILPPHCYRF